MRHILILLMTTLPAQAFAKDGSTALIRVSGFIVETLRTEKIADLHFGRIDSGSGSVEVGTDGTVVYGGTTGVGADDTHAEPAHFRIYGESNFSYTATVVGERTAKTDGGAVIPVESFSIASASLGGHRGFLSSGVDDLRIGGRIVIPDGADAGDYYAKVDVRVVYD